MKEYHDPDVLEKLYHEDGLSLTQIGDKYDVDFTTIHYHMEKHEIERRDPRERGPPTMFMDSHGYEMFKNVHDNETFRFLHHRLIAVAEYGLEAVKDNHVHHKNGLRWDNRPSNLDPMSPSEHRRVENNSRKAKMAEWGRKGGLKTAGK